MSKPNFSGHGSGAATAAEPLVYEIREFVALKPAEGYIKVRHSRTIFDGNGRVHQELLPIDASYDRMIQAFNGYVSTSAGAVNGFFEDPEQAKACARKIEQNFRNQVEVCGTQLTIWV